MHRITVDLGNISRAVRELRAYRAWVENKTHELVTVLCQKGVSIAGEKILSYNAIDTGALDASIFYGVSADGTHGFIRTDSRHAIFVEFGTGVASDRHGSGTHPKAGELGYHYDIHGHGEAGWIYFDEKRNHFYHTKGMRARPFLFETALQLSDTLEETAKEVFSS